MGSELTKEYPKRTLESKTIESNRKTADSEACQIFVSEGFRFGFRLWAKFIAVLRFIPIFCAVFWSLKGSYAPFRYIANFDGAELQFSQILIGVHLNLLVDPTK